MERDYDDVSTESEEEVFDRQNFDCYPNYRRFKRGVLSTEELKDQEGIKRGKYDDKAERFTGHTLSYKILEAIQNEDLERVLMLLDRMKEKGLRLITPEKNGELIQLALKSGFELSDELSGTTWLEIDKRPKVTEVDGFKVVDRTLRTDSGHPMVARNGENVESRLKECSLYDPTLDLAVEDDEGNVAGYALFWFDQTTSVGMLEPLRIEDNYQRRGLASFLIVAGLERLAQKGASRVKVGFESETAAKLYSKVGFVQTSVDRLLTRGSN